MDAHVPVSGILSMILFPYSFPYGFETPEKIIFTVYFPLSKLQIPKQD